MFGLTARLNKSGIIKSRIDYCLINEIVSFEEQCRGSIQHQFSYGFYRAFAEEEFREYPQRQSGLQSRDRYIDSAVIDTAVTRIATAARE